MLDDWADAVRRELELPGEVDPGGTVTLVLDTARDVAHAVARPAAPLTAYLLGIAVGRASAAGTGPGAAELAQRVCDLAAGWAPHQPADDEVAAGTASAAGSGGSAR